MAKQPISLERYRLCVNKCFEALSGSEDGMTMYELHKMTGYPRSTVQIAIENHPLFYVDRWVRSRKGVPSRVFMAAEIKRFDDCPRPEDMKE